MSARVRGIVAVTAVAFSVSGTAVADARLSAPLHRPRLLLTVDRLEAFGQDGPRIAWADTGGVALGAKRCDGVVKERDLRTGRTWNVFRGDREACGQLSNLGGFQHDLAVAGTRVLSSFVSVSNSSYHFDLRLALPGARLRALGSQHIPGGLAEEGPFVPVPLAGDGSTLVYANISSTEETYGYGYVHRAGGSRFAGTWGARAVAASGDAFAAARVDEGGCVCNAVVAVSPDGSRLVVTSRSGPGGVTANTAITTIIRTGDGRVERVVPYVFSTAEWSPDGARLAVNLSDRVAVLDVATGAVRRLARGFQPSWSPNGTLLAYLTYTSRSSRLMVAPGSGGAARDLGPVDTVTSWLAGGSQLLVVRSQDLYVLDVARGTRRLVARNAYSARPSPDGRLVAFPRAAAGGGFFVAAVSGGGERRLGPAVTDFAWSPDSRRIAFLETVRSRLTVAGADGSSVIDVGPAASAGEWSPDGSRIAFVSQATTTAPQLVEVAVPGEQPRALGPGGAPRWSRDGQRLLVEEYQGDIPTTRMVSVDTGPDVALRGVASEGWLPGRERVLLRLSSKGDFRVGELAVAAADLAAPLQLTHTVPARPWKGVEIREATSGNVRWRFATTDEPTAVTLDGARVAVVLRHGKTQRIEVRDRRAGVLRSIPVAADVSRVSLSGRWLVYFSRGSIRAADIRTGRATTLARPSGIVVGLSIDGTRVAWGEQRRSRDAILAVDLPA
jgi:Tol biopolymer transport system component